MNWKRITIWVTIVNILGWLLLELWMARYAEGNAEGGAGFLVFLHLFGYYIIAICSNMKDSFKS